VGRRCARITGTLGRACDRGLCRDCSVHVCWRSVLLATEWYLCRSVSSVYCSRGVSCTRSNGIVSMFQRHILFSHFKSIWRYFSSFMVPARNNRQICGTLNNGCRIDHSSLSHRVHMPSSSSVCLRFTGTFILAPLLQTGRDVDVPSWSTAVDRSQGLVSNLSCV
jgi:hypothetical protein